MFLTVGSAASVESMSLHNTLKSPSFRNTAYRNFITLFEYIHADFVSDSLCRGNRKSPFPKTHEIAELLYMSLHRLVFILWLTSTPSKLYCLVTIFFNSSDVRFNIRRNGHNSNRPSIAALVTHLRHIHFCA